MIVGLYLRRPGLVVSCEWNVRQLIEIDFVLSATIDTDDSKTYVYLIQGNLDIVMWTTHDRL